MSMQTSPKSSIAVFIFLLMTFSLLSCKADKPAEDESTIVIDVEKNIDNFKPVKLSDLNCELEYVVLETNSSSLLANIRLFDKSSDYIAVFDSDGFSSQVFLFDNNGKFISRLGLRGRGPGEYDTTARLKIINGQIFIPDTRRNKIYIYNSSGDFISDFSYPGRSFRAGWFPLTDTTYLFHLPNLTGNESYRLAQINNKGEILKYYPNTTFFNPGPRSRLGTIFQSSVFYETNGNIFFKEPLNDTVWQVMEDHLHPAYIMNLGKYSIPFEVAELHPEKRGEKYRNAIHINNVFETEEYVITWKSFGNNYPFDFFMQEADGPLGPVKRQYCIIGLYDKKNNEYFHVAPSNPDDQIQPTGFENDIDGGINFKPDYAVNDTLLVSVIKAYELIEYVQTETFRNYTPKYPERKEELKKLASSLDENDNPVLMLVRLNK